MLGEAELILPPTVQIKSLILFLGAMGNTLRGFNYVSDVVRSVLLWGMSGRQWIEKGVNRLLEIITFDYYEEAVMNTCVQVFL